MEDLTFGEQVKIILSRKKMTIKQLAELIELQTGQKMSRQNLTQRLGRDNFQEQDMRMIAAILGCPFTLNIITGNEAPAELPIEIKGVRTPKEVETERDMTIGEVYEIHEQLDQLAEEKKAEPEVSPEPEEAVEEQPEASPEPEEAIEEQPEASPESEASPEPEEVVEEQPEEPVERHPAAEQSRHATNPMHHRRVITPKDKEFEPVVKHDDLEEDCVNGDVNPYTGHEYQTNSVRVHPKRIGYVQVYDRLDHRWTDMTEWAFLGYQERKKALLGKDYEPPIYLD